MSAERERELTRALEVASVDVLLGELRRRGQRITTGRRAIAEALVSARDLSAEEIVEIVQRAHPDLHPSTVYRTLETLEEAGLVTHVHLGHGPARWQQADNSFHHLVCEACGMVQLVPRTAFDDLRARIDREFGFEIEFHHFATVGRCAHCRD